MRVEKQMELISFNVPCPCRGERILAAEYEGEGPSAGCRRAKRDDDEGEDKNAKLPLHAAPEVFNNNNKYQGDASAVPAAYWLAEGANVLVCQQTPKWQWLNLEVMRRGPNMQTSTGGGACSG